MSFLEFNPIETFSLLNSVADGHQPDLNTVLKQVRVSALSSDRTAQLLMGDSRNNILKGTAGNDVMRGRGGTDKLSGAGGNDRLFGDAGADHLVGGKGADQLNGGAGADKLMGTGGNDVLVGGAGTDLLVGDRGKDKLTGGTGRDRFVVGAGSATIKLADVITDFTDGEDAIQLAGLTVDRVAIVPGTGANAGDTVLQHKTTGEFLAILKGFNSSNLDASDFVNATAPQPSPGTPGTGALSFSHSAYRLSEGGGSAVITVTRTGSSTGVVTVNYATSNNTATAGQDYTAVSGTLTFNAGEISKTFAVPVTSDSLFESAEVIRLSLSSPGNGGTLGSRTTALLTIANDDNPTQAQIQGKASNTVTVGNTTLYIGHNQVSTGSSTGNQDPWAASFTNGNLNWYCDDYEITPDDSRGTHLVWDGDTNRLYAAFTSTGTQGSPSEDFRRFASNGWLKSYSDFSPGGGGGGRVAILAQLNPADGTVTTATFLTALNGTKTNSVFVQSLMLNGSNLVVSADSAFAPRRADRSAMTSTGEPGTSPNYTIEFAPNLGSVVNVLAVGFA
ncbi:hypothetical protein IQ268_05605 [Oculatella sp. LEGE 06141]|uniref:Calx-beta domain-containing protein n=1 Tax=Oculatella sp. LEGE 06141 TaxID=1828648 RepID=UPI00187E7690|nr:Calx-beta domain-containing protein [Oculatella sp. LEGE 06141]MBE9178060.1 hypothetical protein [Oculatella sp. LEGE 06141]